MKGFSRSRVQTNQMRRMARKPNSRNFKKPLGFKQKKVFFNGQIGLDGLTANQRKIVKERLRPYFDSGVSNMKQLRSLLLKYLSDIFIQIKQLRSTFILKVRGNDSDATLTFNDFRQIVYS